MYSINLPYLNYLRGGHSLLKLNKNLNLNNYTILNQILFYHYLIIFLLINLLMHPINKFFHHILMMLKFKIIQLVKYLKLNQYDLYFIQSLLKIYFAVVFKIFFIKNHSFFSPITNSINTYYSLF
jgi:hypothetical protein